MANQRDPRDKKDEANGYERARRRVKKGPRAQSVMQALASGNVPAPVDALVRDFSKAVLEVSELPTKPLMDPNWDAIQKRQMALGQKLQTICNAILEDPEWKENFLKRITPSDLMRMLDMGIKLERQAQLSIMQNDAEKDRQKEALGHENTGGLTQKAMGNPVLLEALHELYPDDDGDGDEG